MSEAKRVAELLRTALEGKTWHGPALGEVLANVTARQAATAPAVGSHSIWQLTLHAAVWAEQARIDATGGPSRELPPEEDWPPIADTSEAAWSGALARLSESHAALRESIADFSDEQLLAPVPGSKWNVYQTLHGVVAHDLYHAGQIAILKRTNA